MRLPEPAAQGAWTTRRFFSSCLFFRGFVGIDYPGDFKHFHFRGTVAFDFYILGEAAQISLWDEIYLYFSAFPRSYGVLGNSGRVQPQSALALVMTSGALPWFVNSNSVETTPFVIGNYAEVMGFSDECYECVPLCVLFLFASAGAMASSASRVTRIIFS